MVLGLTAAYFLTGKLGLLLAIPPGFATAVWPPSGIALGVLIVSGPRLWPGVLLGSFLVNLTINNQQPADLQTFRPYMIALGIGTAASLQAIAGAYLVRRFVGSPLELIREWEIVKFLGLGGVLSCTINPTVSIGLLALVGTVPWNQVLFNWWTWWVGDVIGVAIFSPLVLIWAGQPREVWKRRRLPITLLLALTFGLAVFFFVRASALEQAKVRIAFESQATPLCSSLRQKLSDSLEVLYSLGDAFSAFPEVDRESFSALVKPALTRHPGIQAVSWNARISEEARASFEDAVRKDGFPQFRIVERNGQGKFVPALARREYVVVSYIEPYEGNEKAIGYDVASEPKRHEALLRASESGRPAATARIRLVQEPGQQAGTLINFPVYENSPPSSAPESSKSKTRGYLTGVFRLGDLAQAALAGHPTNDFRISLWDQLAPVGDRLLWSSDARSDGVADSVSAELRPADRSGFHYALPFDLAGRPWTVVCEGTPEYIALSRSWKPWTVLAGGLLFTGLLGAFLLAATGRAVVIERLGAERAAELSRANAILGKEISERKHAQRNLSEKDLELRQAQKMEAFGRLAGGVAHDFNNLLTPILGYTSIAIGRLQEGDPLKGDLEEVARSAERAASLTRQLLAFSRKQVLQPRVLDLNSVVSDMEKMLRRLIGEDIDLTTSRAPNLGCVKADPGQIDQVLMNLVVNARDAMPNGGKLTIETRGVVPAEAVPSGISGTCPGRYVLLAVSDTGTGMDGETLSHLFEPFFTTKERGKGTGLGLSTVYGIVKQSNGHIKVTSEIGKGSCFQVFLPQVDDLPAERRSDRPTKKLVRGSERILVVEDEDSVRKLSVSVLRSQGYGVLEARNGQEALELLDREVGRIDLIMTDVVMPKISGRELAQRVGKTRPTVKVLYISGYAETSIVPDGVLNGNLAFLGKPFTAGALLKKIREVLDVSHAAT